MTELNSSSILSKEELEARQELFRYTDLSHPVMNALFELQLDVPQSPTSEQD